MKEKTVLRSKISDYDKRENIAHNLRDSGTCKIALVLKELLITKNVSPVNKLYELVLILID